MIFLRSFGPKDKLENIQRQKSLPETSGWSSDGTLPDSQPIKGLKCFEIRRVAIKGYRKTSCSDGNVCLVFSIMF